MPLFKRKEEAKKKPACCCAKAEEVQSVKVLGSGCASCHALYDNTCKAVRDMGLDVEVEYVTDLEKIMSYGVMSMPALVVNGKVVSVGRTLNPGDVEKLLG